MAKQSIDFSFEDQASVSDHALQNREIVGIREANLKKFTSAKAVILGAENNCCMKAQVFSSLGLLGCKKLENFF